MSWTRRRPDRDGAAARWRGRGTRLREPTSIAQCVTFIGIPLGIANFKMIPLTLFPLGREIVPADEPFATR